MLRTPDKPHSVMAPDDGSQMVAEAAGIVPGSLQSTSNEASPAQTSQSFQPQSDSSITSPEFCGPSSSEFTLNVVSGNLKAMGMPAAILSKSTSAPGCPSSSRLAQYGPFMKVLTMDPLWDIKGDDAVDLIDQWCNGVGSLYPVVDRDRMMQTANNVFASLESASRDGVKLAKGSLVETLFNDETNKMKIVLAIGRTLASGGRNDQAQRLFESTTEAVEGLIWNSNGIHGIQLLVLVVSRTYCQRGGVNKNRRYTTITLMKKCEQAGLLGLQQDSVSKWDCTVD